MDALTVFLIITCIQIWSVCQIYIIRSLVQVVKVVAKNILDDEEKAG